ncbi:MULTISPECIES: FHA domain-containing protein [Nostoc]|uniref:FHA domain-containing protein n=1 Tax=Nostoc paludosum FACHB-159 TaxID=2692908 RepID=A0ABR8KFD5_9NOSO|nr:MULTISPECIES: FHA domain-containing protein [Nostoc]MBD2681276.1 FHA domain-containing protein [Nostoc sp. FACHB-857]MBD2737755.1 FHA domain-containing protein [Nostoc paludosum FACHB-159]
MKVKVFNSQTKIRGIELDFEELFTDEDVCLIGRSPDSALVLDSADVSRVHGKFFRQNGEIFYIDLGSTNGSKVNDEIVEPNKTYLLKPGDVIQAGEFILFIQETSDLIEDGTVVRDMDATAFSSLYPDKVDASEKAGVLVKVTPNLEILEPADPKLQTQALLAAINKRILTDIKATGDWTRDTYIKAVSKARESIENNKLIDPEELEKEADKYWRSLSQGTATISTRLGSVAVKSVSQVGTRLGSVAAKGALELKSRLGSAAQAAWKEITTSKSHQEINHSLEKDNGTTDAVMSPDEVQNQSDIANSQTSLADREPSNISLKK